MFYVLTTWRKHGFLKVTFPASSLPQADLGASTSMHSLSSQSSPVTLRMSHVTLVTCELIFPSKLQILEGENCVLFDLLSQLLS